MFFFCFRILKVVLGFGCTFFHRSCLNEIGKEKKYANFPIGTSTVYSFYYLLHGLTLQNQIKFFLFSKFGYHLSRVYYALRMFAGRVFGKVGAAYTIL